jgi:RNA 3'-terminal phosphate cyclase (ATP)
MLEIDGARKSGSGTILRDAVSFSALMGKGVHLTHIRVKRSKPGLGAQHLKALQAVSDLCRGQIHGGNIGSSEIWFKPEPGIRAGTFSWDIGTAGSTTMLVSTVIPLALFATESSVYKITGGLFQDFAPSAFHFKYTLLPLLRGMGVLADFDIITPGYVPRGGGQILFKVKPLKDRLKPFQRKEQGKVVRIRGTALASHLEGRRVSDRMAAECKKVLKGEGYTSKIEVLYDSREHPVYKKAALQAGASLAIYAETSSGCVLGADMAGAPRRTAEYIGKQTAQNLMDDLHSGATVDRHLADQMIPYAALADGWSSYIVPAITDHIESRLWLAEEILGAKIEVRGKLIRIKGIGYKRQ